MNNLLIDELIRFTHPEKTYGYPLAWAALFGLDEAAYQEIRDRFGENARDAALEPLEDPDLASWDGRYSAESDNQGVRRAPVSGENRRRSWPTLSTE